MEKLKTAVLIFEISKAVLACKRWNNVIKKGFIAYSNEILHSHCYIIFIATQQMLLNEHEVAINNCR